MKLCVAGVAVAFLVVPLNASGDEPEPVLAQQAKLLRQATEVVKSIKDTASAKKALPDLERLNKQLGEVEKRLEPFKKRIQAIAKQQSRGARLSQEEAEFLERLRQGKEALDKAEQALRKGGRALDKELLRVEKTPALWKVVRDEPLFRVRRQQLERLARAQATGLSQMVEAYKLNHGDYPATLAALAEKQPNGAPPLVPKDVLLDPWGQPYHLDASGTRNNGNRADVFSTGHPVEKKLIGNWPEPEEKPKGAKKP